MIFDEHVIFLNLFLKNFVERQTFLYHIYVIRIIFVYRKLVPYWKIGSPSLSVVEMKIDQRTEANW